MQPELVFFVLVPFLLSVGSVALVAKWNFARGMTGKDINKKGQGELPEGTGIALLVPLWVSIILFNLIVAENSGFVAFGLTVSVLSIVGFLDDRKQKFKVRTISWTSRAAIVSLVCLMFAMFYAPAPLLLWLVPFAAFVAGLASFQNTFAGLNGWEVGSGFIIACFVAFLLLSEGPWPMGLALAASIAGLLVFNVYPARVFPGDSGTLLIGGGIASLVILTQRLELMALTLLFFLPHAVDFFMLKFLTNRDDMSQSKVLPYSLGPDGRLKAPVGKDGKIRFDFAKLVLKVLGPMPEWAVVAVIWAFVFGNCLFWVAAFGWLGLL